MPLASQELYGVALRGKAGDSDLTLHGPASDGALDDLVSTTTIFYRLSRFVDS